LAQAVELGITFWDTANAYGFGTSEEIVGRAVRKYTRREDANRLPVGTFRSLPGGSLSSRSLS
jgi:predicted aldo/keto reductase-like oxidoreductase